jgi:hypothetical protein
MGSQKITHVWVVENCGKELSEESIDLRRADTIASLLRWRRLLVRMKRTCWARTCTTRTRVLRMRMVLMRMDHLMAEDDIDGDEPNMNGADGNVATAVAAQEERGNRDPGWSDLTTGWNPINKN